MREIKFRVFNTYTKKMIDWYELCKNDRENKLSMHNVLNGFVDFIIPMQFTGLYDKDGKEIYEGDIVKYYQPYAKRTDIHVVKWDNPWAAFGLFEKDNEWCKESDWQKITDVEVIGNMHENPKLLK